MGLRAHLRRRVGGHHDFVKDVLDEVGAIDFWQVAMQPGRPLAVGRVGDTPFFGLPGNPVASMLAFMLFVRPALYKRAGRRRLFPDTWQARVTQPLRKKVGRREFKRGVMRFAAGLRRIQGGAGRQGEPDSGDAERQAAGQTGGRAA